MLIMYIIHRIPDLQVSLLLTLPEVSADSSPLHGELLVLREEHRGEST